ncbi:hypothetical protein FD35_GL001762 [Furfurilactobacillus rossiae DSM 15814]|uniref:Uncharacterized protein n=2 Tax=Furfurilactobacillus rossiae TaxID=231049 RepID=A0A0R1RIS9_9LACO|nr:hypothetical protein FD35_GL001762 [Furfurilactobacillus rossiae DSM 15814]
MIVDVAVIRALVVPFLVTTLLAQVATEGHFKWLNFKFILSAFWNEVNVYELLVSASLLWLALNNIQAGHTFLGGIMRLKNAGLNLQTLTSAGGLLWLFIIGSSLVTTSIFEEE